jgi:pSer/pThr/pTyr-binding forkhead associated (FHA) protein
VNIREASISKLHAHFLLREGGVFDLIDLGSQNGTAVNGKPLVANEGVRVGSGDRIRFGAVNCTLVNEKLFYDIYS